MKYFLSRLIAAFMVIGFFSCQSGGANAENDTSTAPRRAMDTTMLPGTPGPSGSQPRASDTTQAHRDSLKHMHSIDTTGKRVSTLLSPINFIPNFILTE